MFGLMDYWERMAPRERRLVTLLGIVVLVGLFVIIGVQIKRGLSSLEDQNAATLEALELLEKKQAQDAEPKTIEQMAAESIGETSPPLGSYLEDISKSVEITVRQATARPPGPPKGGFIEKAVDIELRGITLDQLARFLKQVETRSPGVVTQRMYVKPYIGDRVRLDADLTISVFERVKKEKAGAAEDKPAGDGAKEGG
jgi:hypothetical protein